MGKRILPTPDQLRELLRYDPDTGKLFWKCRPREMFASERLYRSWNSRRKDAEAMTHVNTNGYKVGIVLKKGCKAHRAAWALHYGEWPSLDLDHINGDKTDNRISNLREATLSENKRNTKMYRNNKCGFKGVHWSKSSAAWSSRIGYKGVQIALGKFETPEAAHAAYCEAAKIYHGKFARTE